MSENELTVTRLFNTTKENLWVIWTTPSNIEKWYGPKGFNTKVKSMEFKVGGKFELLMSGPGGNEHSIKGEYTEIIENEKIVDSSMNGNVITTVFFESEGDKTKLTLTMRLKTAEEKQKFEQMGVMKGWNSSFERIDELL